METWCRVSVVADLMFKAIDKHSEMVEISLNGQQVRVPEGVNVAAALLLQSAVCRTTVVSKALRGPFCMMGVCFDCLVEIDGIANQQSCQKLVEQGMRVVFQEGAVEAERLDNHE